MYDIQTWNDGPAGNTPITAEKLTRIEEGIELVAKKRLYIPRNSMFGSAHTEAPVFTGGTAGDVAFNESYILPGGIALPTVWPVDCWGDNTVTSQNWSSKGSAATLATAATYRFMYDGTDLIILCLGGLELNMFVDGQPLSANPFLTVVSAGLGAFGYQKFVFATARPRLIEFRAVTGLAGLYGKKPYRMWKPAADPNPKVAVVGDSFVYPTTLSNTLAAAFTPDPYIRGMYQAMASQLGITSMVSDGLNGTGYIAAGAFQAYPHANRLAWLDRIQPDVIVVHGGGANDLYTGSSVASIIAAATSYFQALRSQHPDAKLVFVEGFSPPAFVPATFNPSYILIREGLQEALDDAGVGAYYLDIATTRPPLTGAGYVLATTGIGNSDIYIGHDGAHPTGAGAAYLRSVVADKLKRVLADHNGELEGTLIY